MASPSVDAPPTTSSCWPSPKRSAVAAVENVLSAVKNGHPVSTDPDEASRAKASWPSGTGEDVGGALQVAHRERRRHGVPRARVADRVGGHGAPKRLPVGVESQVGADGRRLGVPGAHKD